MIIQINDISEINNIFIKIFNENLKTNVYSKIIGYKLMNQIVGFCIFDIIYDRCEIEYIGVLNDYRNRSIASKLMDYIICYCKKNKVFNISLEVNVNNFNAIKLYEKYNFKKETIRKNYYKNNDAYLMVKEV